MTTFFEKYIVSLILLLSFIVLSPLFTNWYQDNVLIFSIMVIILASGNFLIENISNKKYPEIKLKTKKISIFLLPLNWVVAIGFLFLVFS